jgi:hypothetical protein
LDVNEDAFGRHLGSQVLPLVDVFLGYREIDRSAGRNFDFETVDAFRGFERRGGGDQLETAANRRLDDRRALQTLDRVNEVAALALARSQELADGRRIEILALLTLAFQRQSR